MPVLKSVVPKKILSILADLLTMVSREELINAINTIPQSAIDAPDDDYESGEEEDLPPAKPKAKKAPAPKKEKAVKEPKPKAAKAPKPKKEKAVIVKDPDQPKPKKTLTDEQKSKLKEGRLKKKQENALQQALDNAVEKELPEEDTD